MQNNHGLYTQNINWLDSRLKKRLIIQAESRQLHHFILFSSPSSSALSQVSRALALDWLQVPFRKGETLESICHPDLIVARPQGKTGVYSVEAIRDILQELSLKSFSGIGRVIIFDLAEKLSLAAANAFLKALEEPPQNTIFIMNTLRLDRIIPTMISRSQVIRLPCSAKEDVGITHDFPNHFVESLRALFLTTGEKTLYHDIKKVGDQVQKITEELQKQIVKDVQRKAKHQAAIHDEDSKADIKEFEVLVRIIEQGEKILDLIKLFWQQQLTQKNTNQLAGNRRQLFPDESLLYFYSAYRALELGVSLEETITQLLLSLFGFITPDKPHSFFA